MIRTIIYVKKLPIWFKKIENSTLRTSHQILIRKIETYLYLFGDVYLEANIGYLYISIPALLDTGIINLTYQHPI